MSDEQKEKKEGDPSGSLENEFGKLAMKEWKRLYKHHPTWAVVIAIAAAGFFLWFKFGSPHGPEVAVAAAPTEHHPVAPEPKPAEGAVTVSGEQTHVGPETNSRNQPQYIYINNNNTPSTPPALAPAAPPQAEPKDNTREKGLQLGPQTSPEPAPADPQPPRYKGMLELYFAKEHHNPVIDATLVTTYHQAHDSFPQSPTNYIPTVKHFLQIRETESNGFAKSIANLDKIHLKPPISDDPRQMFCNVVTYLDGRPLTRNIADAVVILLTAIEQFEDYGPLLPDNLRNTIRDLGEKALPFEADPEKKRELQEAINALVERRADPLCDLSISWDWKSRRLVTTPPWTMPWDNPRLPSTVSTFPFRGHGSGSTRYAGVGRMPSYVSDWATVTKYQPGQFLSGFQIVSPTVVAANGLVMSPGEPPGCATRPRPEKVSSGDWTGSESALLPVTGAYSSISRFGGALNSSFENNLHYGWSHSSAAMATAPKEAASYSPAAVERAPGCRRVSWKQDMEEVWSGDPIPPRGPFAIVIGVSHYTSSELLHNADDAQRVGATIHGLGGTVALATDSIQSKADLLCGMQSLGEYSTADPAIFFFSGHGMEDSDGVSWLMLTDTEKVSVPEIRKAFGRRLYVVMDACSHRAAPEVTSNVKSIRLRSTYDGDSWLVRPKGAAFESDILGGGIVTAAFVQALLSTEGAGVTSCYYNRSTVEPIACRKVHGDSHPACSKTSFSSSTAGPIASVWENVSGDVQDVAAGVRYPVYFRETPLATIRMPDEGKSEYCGMPLDLGSPTGHTPYDQYLAPMWEVLHKLGGANPDMSAVDHLVAEGRGFRYAFNMEQLYAPQTPEVTESIKSRDCKVGTVGVRYDFMKPRHFGLVSFWDGNVYVDHDDKNLMSWTRLENPLRPTTFSTASRETFEPFGAVIPRVMVP